MFWNIMNRGLTKGSQQKLCLFITPKLVWSKTIEMLSRQALKSSFCIFRYQRDFGQFHPKDMIKLFDSIVKPILCYGAEIWGYEYKSRIEQVHVKFCRKYCNLSSKTNSILALGECGRLPICITYMTKCIKYWTRMICMDRSRYPRQSYEMLKRLDEVGRLNWTSRIRNLLFTYGFEYAWIAQNIGNPKYFVALFTERLSDCYR